jgi:hypothetical protein
MDSFVWMSREERSLYNLERTLIERHFTGLSPRAVSLVEAADFDARPRDPRMVVSRRALALPPEERAALLTHALVHYELKDAGEAQWRGHGPRFARKAARLGVYSAAVAQRCFSITEWLDEPSLRSGPHAVQARVIDVVFGLVDSYREELDDFFINERWLRGGHRFPDSLLPFVKFYSEEITDLLAVGVCVEKLTLGAPEIP